jgi:hypothetical protein
MEAEPDYALETAEGALARARFWMDSTRLEFEAEGELVDNPRAIIFCRKVLTLPPGQSRPVAGAPLPYPVERPCYLPRIVRPLISPGKHCAALVKLAKDLAIECDAPGAIFMMEAWFLHDRELPPGEQVKDQLDRREGLFVSLEHRKLGRRIWVAPILRNPTRLEPWAEPPSPNALQGRVAGIIAGLPSSN